MSSFIGKNILKVQKQTCSAAEGSRAKIEAATSLSRQPMATTNGVCPNRSFNEKLSSGWLSRMRVMIGFFVVIAM